MKSISLMNLVLCCLGVLFCFGVAAQDTDSAQYSIDLESIVITASKIEQQYKYSTQNISIISKEDIESGVKTEVTEILDLLPSVDILEYGSTGSTRSVHTRGASSSQVATLIDGRPVNTPRDGITDFNQISLSNVERIEVLRGPASSMYGANAVGGVINIITKNGKENPGTSIVSKFGSFSTIFSSLTHANKLGDFDYFIFYDRQSSHGHRDNSDYVSHNTNTKLGYQLDEDNRLEVSGGYYNSEVGSPGQLSFLDLDDRNESFKRYLDLTYKGKIVEGQDILLKLFNVIDRFEFVETFEPIDKATHQTKVYGLDAQLSQTFFDVFRTAFGFSYQQHKINSTSSAKHEYNLKGIYCESETDIFSTGSLKLGARWDDYSNFGDRISPSASFNFWLFDKIKLHALAAKSFRAPTFNDLYWPREDWGAFGGVEGNRNLKPETAVSYEAGISGYFLNRFKTDITLFKTNFEDLIEWTVDNTWWWRPENISSASIKGLEFETEFVMKENLKANFNYTYLESKNKSTNEWLIYRPRHLYKMRLAYSPAPKYEFGLNCIYKTKRFTNATNTTFLRNHFVMNFDCSYEVNDSLKLSFEAKNIFDRVYQEERDYSMPGRTFYGGVKVSF